MSKRRTINRKLRKRVRKMIKKIVKKVIKKIQKMKMMTVKRNSPMSTKISDWQNQSKELSSRFCDILN